MPVIDRNKRLHVMLSEDEWHMVHALAEQAGQGVSDWTRQMIRSAARRAKVKAKPAKVQPRRTRKTTKKRRKRA